MEQPLTHWSAYWHAGARHSLPQDFAGNYDRELGQFWAKQFGLLSSDERMLDLCTGSGAIAMLARKQLPASVSITAIDGAALDPAALAAIWPEESGFLKDIEFVFGCPIETITDDHVSGPFDLVSSQYGLEYCDLEVVAPIVGGWVKPGGRLVLVTHAMDSEMAHAMANEARDYEVLAEHGYFKLLASWAKGQLSGQALVDRLNRVMASLMPIYQKTSSPLLAQVIQSGRIALGQPMGQLMGQRQLAADYLAQLQAAHQRLLDMQRVTEKVGRGHDWLSPLIKKGLALQDQGEIRIDGEHLAGLTWVLEKPA